jgi:TetR/AcrR family transcriptional regulator, mexJK operon transcriptional repressor
MTGRGVDSEMTGTVHRPRDERAPAREAATLRTRGRPSVRQAESISAAVLGAARACFLANGFTGTTMDAIARKAGVSKVTLYQRYPDKVALLRAVMQDRNASWSAISSSRAVAMGETLDERLRHYARSLLHWSRHEEVRAFGDLIRECWGSARSVAEEMQTIRTARMLEVLQRDIIELGAKDAMIARNPEQLARIFQGMLTAFPMPDGDPAAIERQIADFADDIVDILMTGRSGWMVGG